MKKITYLFLLFVSFNAFSQSKKALCNCAKNDFAPSNAEKNYSLANGKIISLCGYKNAKSYPISYSEFVLSECGKKEIIDFWGANFTGEISVDKNTLIIKQLESLPTGKDFIYEHNWWSTEKINFEKDELKREIIINRNIKKYTLTQQKKAIVNYKNAPIEVNEHTMEVLDQIFMAIISGNKEARIYFSTFKEHFDLQGANSYIYRLLTDMLNDWDTNVK